ncbi:chorismate mutase [Desulfohalotomaculum tongense]|uniref:chorismate mutase n=1 Tax=Desulforadius tongensis TaxID=1216062 RepID=UPI00195A3866|nr:chorismate mutase [Desulforadius tongensis]
MGKVKVRGIRGAITVEKNTSQDMTEAIRELLNAIVRENHLKLEDICSVFFTVTKDLNAQFPARAAREMGWDNVPMICAQELDVPGSLPRCIRVMMHVNTAVAQEEVKHVYLREAVSLRPDWAGK